EPRPEPEPDHAASTKTSPIGSTARIVKPCARSRVDDRIPCRPCVYAVYVAIMAPDSRSASVLIRCGVGEHPVQLSGTLVETDDDRDSGPGSGEADPRSPWCLISKPNAAVCLVFIGPALTIGPHCLRLRDTQLDQRAISVDEHLIDGVLPAVAAILKCA